MLKCKVCEKQFTVTVGTILEKSHIPLHKWLKAVQLLGSSKKAINARQLHRILGITHKSALFLINRIRQDISQPSLINKLQDTIEIDKLYIGGTHEEKCGCSPETKRSALHLCGCPRINQI